MYKVQEKQTKTNSSTTKAKSLTGQLTCIWKQWSDNNSASFVHLADHTTIYCNFCAIYTDKREETARKLFQHQVIIFKTQDKFLVDTGDEFANKELISFCKNLNSGICARATEIPWSMGWWKFITQN